MGVVFTKREEISKMINEKKYLSFVSSWVGVRKKRRAPIQENKIEKL